MMSATPISASGPVASTTSIRFTFWSWSISRMTITKMAKGTAAMVAFWLMLLCSSDPPLTMEAPDGRSRRSASICGSIRFVRSLACSPSTSAEMVMVG